MQEFLSRHASKITGVLSCFDRVVFHGHLPLGYPHAMERYLNARGCLLKDFKTFVTQQSERLKTHAQAVAAQANRPYIYLEGYTRKEDLVQDLVRKEGLTVGLVCVLAAVEPCQSFKLCYGKRRPTLKSAKCKCLHFYFYFYFLDREYGFMHVRVQSWFPFQIQVCLNGHDWLAHKLDRHGVAYCRQDNAFLAIEGPPRAQKFADQMVNKNWPRILTAFARKVNPLLQNILAESQYYWVTDQAEYATDVIFQDPAALHSLYQKLLRHAVVCFSAEDVMTFLGRKLHGLFKGELVNDYKHRLPGARVKHRMKKNWIKMYDKFGSVLRIETVINHPYEFKVRRTGKRKGHIVTDWFPMPKGVAHLYRYAEVSLQANRRYLDALAAVEDPAQSYHLLDRVCQPATFNGRKVGASILSHTRTRNSSPP